MIPLAFNVGAIFSSCILHELLHLESFCQNKKTIAFDSEFGVHGF